ncbi:type IV toxin-antitoxin system AbiEi family antitoxin domain-containing protein [Arcanobacterium phocisimile]|uniref:Type IV toxin-antitoxin system AbiEi family antitoxin domain-containing protein n=1 Tax=Arcanobacterium phocisimile TaxID=1302235 RepID=A0ABX7IF44_9ACTO|nr:type IV toxin-antitoxin system AbiEi family antitoxin domain-containing protein [Arcanobacterium phocisimile]QRV01759.1 type IV toxin-antitoxin system AbiEi family antitoxin domain-containing protein [Arcanobacterium phocisimile]
MEEFENLAMSQWGMFTTAQAQQMGVRRNQISRLRDAGRVEELTYGVYQYVSGNQTSHADVKAAWLSVFPKETVYDRLNKPNFDAVISGRTAAYMHGVGDFHASPYTFTLSVRKQTTRDDIRYFRQEIDPKDIILVEQVPVTTMERTIYDLIRLGEDPDLIANIIADAARNEYRFDQERLAYLLKPLAKKHGYSTGDGEAFARDLFTRNAALLQLNAGVATLAQSFEMITEAGKAMRAQHNMLKDSAEAIAKTTGLYSESYRSLMRTLSMASEIQGWFKSLELGKETMESLNASFRQSTPDFSELNAILGKKSADD